MDFKFSDVTNIDEIEFETRARGSKYDPVIEAAAALKVGQAFIVEVPDDFETESENEPVVAFQLLLRQALAKHNKDPQTSLSFRIKSDNEVMIGRKSRKERKNKAGDKTEKKGLLA